MKAQILILGGTRYFGKRLVSQLLEDGCAVTIATRAKTPDPFADAVHRIIIDRYDRTSLAQGVGNSVWDVIYDQICYSSADAADACEIFSGRTGRYILTSTLSVYEPGILHKETDFDPLTYPIVMKRRQQFTYQEGKRNAEAFFFQKADFPVVAVRFPIVLGSDDYTMRLHEPVRKVAQGLPFCITNRSAALSLVCSQDAAAFLSWAGFNLRQGTYNAASPDPVTIGILIEMIENVTGKKALCGADTGDEKLSMIAASDSCTLDTTEVESAGFHFTPCSRWLQPLIVEFNEALHKKSDNRGV
ncbi:MAG: NAD-dependent dehydratase [Chitinivibrionales bacterium]|nr:NAD-dependent dehydratase [Chitinivibrionales bacterium]